MYDELTSCHLASSIFLLLNPVAIWQQGCDGSVLIDSTANNTAEKDAPPNKPSLRGFEVIDAEKKAIKAQCPKTVSCTGILAFTAHDSIALGGDVAHKVPAGRRDGRTSTDQNALNNLPSLVTTLNSF